LRPASPDAPSSDPSASSMREAASETVMPCFYQPRTAFATETEYVLTPSRCNI
jgi:hypothetical protein